MEWKLGEIKQIDGEWYQCVEGNTCNDCAFYRSSCGSLTGKGSCRHDFREDATNVIFKKLEKVGEPTMLDGRLVQKILTTDRYLCNGCCFESPECDKADNDLCCGYEIYVEIKQTKEDMEIVENVLSQEQIDELRRYETAKEFMSVIMGRANFDPINAPIMCCSCSGEKINLYSYIATISVQAADALLEALKGKGDTGMETRNIQSSDGVS